MIFKIHSETSCLKRHLRKDSVCFTHKTQIYYLYWLSHAYTRNLLLLFQCLQSLKDIKFFSDFIPEDEI